MYREGIGHRSHLPIRFGAGCLLTILLGGCGGEGAQSITERVHRGEVVVRGPDQIVYPSGMVVVGAMVVLADDEAPYIRLLNLASGTTLDAAGVGGSGPHELRRPSTISMSARNRERKIVTVFDSRLQRVSHWSIRDSLLAPVGEDLQLIEATGFGDVFELPSGKFLGVGSFQHGAFAVLGSDGRLLHFDGIVPFVSTDVNQALAQQIVAGSSTVDPSGQRLAIGARYAGRIDIYQLSSGRRDSVETPTPFIPEIRAGSNGAMPVFRTDGDTKLGFISVTSSRCCIYGLFSGRTRKTFPLAASYAREIQVFRWDGTFIRSIRVDRDLFKIVAPPDGEFILGLADDPQPTIVRYDL